jgi:hypothetical protein
VITATGNLSRASVSTLLKSGYPSYFFQDECRILDPAQAVNVKRQLSVPLSDNYSSLFPSAKLVVVISFFLVLFLSL